MGCGGDTPAVIRDAVLHLTGKLPLLVDLHAPPAAGDVSLLATNVRTRDGKRPTFAENTDSWFVIPLREGEVMLVTAVNTAAVPRWRIAS